MSREKHLRVMADLARNDINIFSVNMADYLKAGAVGFGLGSNIVNKKMIEEDDYASITALAQKCVEAIK